MSKNKKLTTSPQLKQTLDHSVESPLSFLSLEYTRWQTLYQAQPLLTQRFFEAQALNLADALIQPASQVGFTLPDKIFVVKEAKAETLIPADQRDQLVGGLMERLTRTGLNVALRQRLDEMGASSNEAVVVSSGLIRFSTASTLVHDLLPSGRSVRYQAAEGEEIPTLPVTDEQDVGSAITAATDAIAVEGEGTPEAGRGELVVPFVPAARRFFLPQWVAFDDQDHLLVNSISEAEAHLASMQRFVRILHMAVALAPFMVVDEQYQQKRYGMLGQLVNQGRALARYETREIIKTIKRRSAAHDLNRGLSISLPYFDDQTLEMKTHDFDVIPAGRVMFVPAFVVLAVQKELVKVEQDTRLSRSTRKHLLEELQMLGFSFADQSK